MRFTPTAFFGADFTEPCMSATANGSVSQSLSFGGANWDVYVFSASTYLGGSGTELYSFEVNEGFTTKGIVAVVGGGGSTSSDNRCGGGGAVSYQENVLLKSGVPYSVTIGQGANGTDNATPQSFSGDNGSQSRFNGGGIDITANGGSGGTQGGNGGNSGDGNTSSGTGGAGSGAGTSGGTYAGPGKTVSVGGLDVFAGDTRPIFRAGGGAGSGGDYSGRSFGGGENVGDQTGRGSAEQFVNNVRVFGGGSGGGEYFDTTDSRYKSHPAGSGCVMIAIPTNLCTSSLYTIKNVDKEGLLNYWDFTNVRSVGKNAGTTEIIDLQRVKNLNHASNLPSASIDTGSLIIHNADKDVNNFYTDSDFAYLNRTTRGLTLGGEPRIEDFLSASVTLPTSTEFSVEYIGAKTNDADNNSFILSGSNGGYIELVNPSNGNSYVRYRPTPTSGVFDTSTFNYGTSKTQNVITYDGTDLKWYVDTVLKDTITTSITSSLDNPDFYIGVDELRRTIGTTQFSECRLYNVALSTASIEQNYSASFGL